MSNQIIKYCILSLSIFILTACGFHLRGNYHLPSNFQNVYVDYVQPYDPFVLKIKQALTNSGVSMVYDATQADYVFHITQIQQIPNLQSTSTTGQVNVYSIQYIVNFNITDKSGKIILPDSQAQASTQYTVSSNQPLIGFNQDPTLGGQLQQEVINQIMFRLTGKSMQKAFAAQAQILPA